MNKEWTKRIIGNTLKKIKHRVFKKNKRYPLDSDMDKEFENIYFKAQPYTMTSLHRMYSLYKATEYVIKNDIPGDIVECGVWRGGSMMISALTLMNARNTHKKLYLYDTYAGMSEPSEKDITLISKKEALSRWKELQEDGFNKWDYSPLEEAERNLFSTGYPKEKLIFIKGKVENTIPKNVPEKISILRLDTDWYESTLHELVHLFPRLSVGGILIIDDYGHWGGSKQAVDQYFEEKKIPFFLGRIDYTGRIGIKIF